MFIWTWLTMVVWTVVWMFFLSSLTHVRFTMKTCMDYCRKTLQLQILKRCSYIYNIKWRWLHYKTYTYEKHNNIHKTVQSSTQTWNSRYKNTSSRSATEGFFDNNPYRSHWWYLHLMFVSISQRSESVTLLN
jgi:hypothetical protein